MTDVVSPLRRRAAACLDGGLCTVSGPAAIVVAILAAITAIH